MWANGSPSGWPAHQPAGRPAGRPAVESSCLKKTGRMGLQRIKIPTVFLFQTFWFFPGISVIGQNQSGSPQFFYSRHERPIR